MEELFEGLDEPLDELPELEEEPSEPLDAEPESVDPLEVEELPESPDPELVPESFPDPVEVLVSRESVR